MPGFVKPTRKVVNIEDAFGELIGKKLIKDLHDNEEICPVCHGIGLRIEDNPYGLSDDPDKRAGQFPYKHQSIRFCPNCYNGVVRFCPDCGKQIPRCRTLCDCDAVVQRRQQEEIRKEKERLEKAEKHEPNALGSLFTMAQSDFYSHNEGYFSCWEDFFDSWNEDREEFTGKPLYVWGTEEVEMSFDASSIVSNACEDNSRLRAEYIYCDHADVCSVYKEGKCFRKTTLFGVRCEFGRIAYVDGGTKKTKMYGRVYSEAKDSERYHKLSYPNNTYIAKIGDGAFLAPPYVRIERGPDSRLFCHNPGFGCNRLFVSIDELTPDNINRICTYHPRAMLGEEIKSYQTEIIPLFLRQLSKLFPEQYNAFIAAFPDYELKAPDYRGKYAKLSTYNRELTYRDAHGNSFRFDGNELVCDKYRIGGFMPFSSSGYAQMRIPVTDDMQVKITDSNQVTDQTVLM